MKGTKLWAQAGSPLIYGQSRTRRPLWMGWLIGFAAALSALLAVAWWLWTGNGVDGAAPSAAGTAAAVFTLTPMIVSCAAGAWVAAWLAQRMGSRRPWAAGAIGGFVTGALGWGFYALWSTLMAGK